MQMEAGLDTGPVLLRDALEIEAEETTAELHDRLSVLGARLIVEALAGLDGLEAKMQPEEGVTYAAKIAKAPLITLQATKAGILRAWENMGFRTHQQASNDLQAVVTGSKEFQDYMVELMKKAAKPSDRV